jgi:subtilisin
MEGWHLDTFNFLHLLNEEIGLAKETAKKHILHFPSAKEHRSFISQLAKLTSSLPPLASVQDLGIIHAVSCSLRSGVRLEQAPCILGIEEDTELSVHRIVEIKRISVPKSQLVPHSQIIPWGVDQIKAPDAWNRSQGNRVRIGVIDTGIDFNHPDLLHSVARGVNLLNRNFLPFDDNGHGTHIAGTIAAASNQNGIIGVAPRAVVHPVKAFDYNGSAYVSDIIAGIDWCVQNDLDIINMSFGMKTYSKSLEYAVLNAYQSGKIIIASSGNDGRKASVDYPARFIKVVSVGATTRNNKIAPFSNRGPSIDIYAPGERIYSAWLHGMYNELSGTSMATAHVSGVVALMLAVRPDLKPLQIKRILKRNAVSLSRSRGTQWQAGQLNARRVMSALK